MPSAILSNNSIASGGAITTTALECSCKAIGMCDMSSPMGLLSANWCITWMNDSAGTFSKRKIRIWGLGR